MADIESLMYSYPVQGQRGFTAILSTREELWPTSYDVQKSAAEEQEASAAAASTTTTEDRRQRSRSKQAAAAAAAEEAEGVSPPIGELPVSAGGSIDPSQLKNVDVARHAVRVFCERFILAYDRLFLYYSTGAGKTTISSGATEPLVRGMTKELVDSYLEPRRTNLKHVIVIVSSDAQRRDFMKKIIETSRRPQYERAVRIGASQPILEKMATYMAALSPFYIFHTKTSFITKIYGTGNTHGDVDPTKPDPGGLTFANNSIIIIDEIHSFSREESVSSTAAAARREETAEEEEAAATSGATAEDEASGSSSSPLRHEEDFRYAQYHYVLHAVQGSKIIGLSATPMKDSPREIAKVMNLLLPLDRQIPAAINVLSRDDMLPYLRGYVSYFKTRSTRVMNRGVMFSLAPPQKEDSHGVRTAEDEDALIVRPSGETGGNDVPEFEVLFPVQMSTLQTAVYKRVISERDSFNRNALRASNVVYPDGTSGHAGFIERYVKSTRGWDGMEPTDEHRTYLRASRANREAISPKFCAIADLCRISRGVVFVYTRNLECGLFDLASFLEAEGFERFVPQTSQTQFLTREDGIHEMLISRKLRYALVIGETKIVPGRLEGITDVVNLDENADGEYIKVVLGSAAVRESFDIYNSITMIIASPEQTETAHIQAQGRIIRPKAQTALLRKFPFLPPIVSVYRMASYIPGTEYEGVDIRTYLESARKDREIKVVERMLRDASVDCRMLHSLNFDDSDDVIDDSPACLYGMCDYACDIEPPSTQDTEQQLDTLDSSSMNALYRGEKILRLRAELTKAASRNTYIPIADIDAAVESHALAQRVIETMGMSKEQLRDRYGRQVYIYHDRNGVFFSPSPVLTGLVGDGSGGVSPVSMSDYEHYITTTLITPLDLLVGGTSLLLPGILETILTVTPKRAVTKSIPADLDLLKNFALYIRREIVPKSDLLEHVRVRGEQRVRGVQGDMVYWVNYSGLLYARGDLRVYEGDEGITPLVEKRGSGQPLHILQNVADRDYDYDEEVAGTWGPPEPVLMRILHHRWRNYMRTLFTPFESRYEYYGVIRPSEPHILRIARRGRDNAKTPGRALPSWSSEDLRLVIGSLMPSKEVDLIISRLTKPKDVNEFLTKEFEKRGMLLRL